MESTEQVRESFLQLWSRLGPLWGIPPSTARVHAWLLARPEGADAETLCASLELSRGAVSMACRELVDWGLLSSGRPSGERRVVFRAQDDLEKAIVGIIRTRKRREWDPLLTAVRDWQNELDGEVGEDATQLRRLFTDIEGVVAMVEATARAFLEGFVIRQIGLKTLLKAARRKERAA